MLYQAIQKQVLIDIKLSTNSLQTIFVYLHQQLSSK